MRLPALLPRAVVLSALSALAAPGLAQPALTLRVPGVLRVLVSADEMPEVFSFEVRPPLPGFERELVEGFTRAHKLELRIVPVKNFDQIIPMLTRGDGDLIVGIVDTEARRQRINFTSETYPVRHVVVTRKPQPPAATLAALKALKVAVIPGTTWADATTEAGVPAAQQVPVADATEALDALKKGRAQATVMAVFDFALARKYDPALEAGAFLGETGVAAWGVRKEDGGLLRALNDYLFTLRMSPAKSSMLVKYFREDGLVLLKQAPKD
jgi:ABC-type amino acid transport substrate-binding protein